MAKKRLYGLEPDQVKRLFDLGTNNGEGADSPESGVQPSPGGEESKEPPPAENQTESLVSSLEQVGQRIGPYKLLSVLGEGGMGMVYLAEQQGSIRRRVALKVIKPGMDSKRVIVRFESERQALALLDHPNIAQVYDAGATPSGRPYFVMEYVRGLTVTEYCDRHKLSIDERLRLFQQVCHAVQHAHQKGIIHRDIKPSNILVSAEGDRAIPKIIDFGVAKAMSQPLTEHTLFTEDSQLLGTPEYMSPEQAEMINEDIDTRSDIYSLGVLLYVLLAGILPYDSKTFRQGGIEHIRQIIRETDPKTPSTRLTKLGKEAKKVAEKRRTEVAALAKCLHKELEWIPLKAMRKERAERYRSASELSDDIENYMKGEPLMAGPPTAGYRLNKFLRRHKTLVGGIAAVLAVSVIGAIVSVTFALGQARALDKADRALAEADCTLAESQLVNEYLYRGILQPLGNRRNRQLTAPDILAIAEKNLEDRFKDYPLTEAKIRGQLGSVYLWGLNDYNAAVKQLEQSHLIREQLGEKLEGSNDLGMAYRGQGRYEEAALQLESVVERLRRLGIVKSWHGLMWGNLANVYIDQGLYNEAERLILESRSRHVAGASESWEGLAEVYRLQGREKEAERSYREGIKNTQTIDNYKWGFWFYRCGLGQLYTAQGRHDEADALLMEVWEKAREKKIEESLSLFRCINCLAVLRREQGKYPEAEDLFLKALDGRKRKLGEDNPATLQTINDFGVLRREQKDYDEAESLLRQALEGRQRKLGNDHPACFESMHELAILHVVQSQYDEAEPLLLKAFHGRETKLGPGHPHTLETVSQLVGLCESLNKPDETEEWRGKLPVVENAVE
jgi:eukaryotic-like serine/threonine-protein kinase